MDKLISLERTKKEIRNYIEDDSMLTLLDCILDNVPSVDPMAKGQWMRLDLIVKTIRAHAESDKLEGKRESAYSLDELANFFEMLSNTIKEKADE